MNDKLKRGYGPAGVFVCLFCLLFGCAEAFGAQVEVREVGRGWELLVDEKPFYIRGVGCGLARGQGGEDYLRLAKELGANCVRTWGTDQGSLQYLDAAARNGLMVDAGIWINWAEPDKKISYLTDNDYLRDKRREALDYVRRFKDHPAVLMWNVGNEAIFFTKSEDERVALARYLEGLIKEIHQIDPKHPVVYASAGPFDLPYLKKYVPSVDIIGGNVYGSIRFFHSRWELLGFDKPYVITEFGPALPNDCGKDLNGRPQELGDYQKAMFYRDLNAQIAGYQGDSLGGFAFHLGETTQDSMSWWNINERSHKRQSFWALYEAYTGSKAPFTAPKLRKLSVNKIKGLLPGETVEARIELKEGGTAGLSFDWRLSTAVEGVLQYYVNRFVDVEAVNAGGPSATVRLPANAGTYRLYCFVTDKNGNISSLNTTLQVGS